MTTEVDNALSGQSVRLGKIRKAAQIDPNLVSSDVVFSMACLANKTEVEGSALWWFIGHHNPQKATRLIFSRIARDLVLPDMEWPLRRATRRLEVSGLLTARALVGCYTDVQLHQDALTAFAQAAVPLVARVANPAHSIAGLAAPTAFARLCMLLHNREQAMLLCWLHQAGAVDAPVQLTTRAIEQALMGLVDRRTAMRVLERLAVAGLVSIEPRGRAGSVYALNGPALLQLLDSFPFPAEAAMSLPGWAMRSRPLFEHIAALTTVEASAIADAQQLTTGAEDGVAGVDGSTVHAGATLNLAGIPAGAAGASAQLSQEA